MDAFNVAMGDEQLAGENMNWTRETPFQALALTGGGYRGLFTAKALQVMEEHVGEPIGRHFDLTCGTSIGGIVALAIAFEVPMAKVVKTFEDFGTTIFPEGKRGSFLGPIGDLLRYAKKPRYQASDLRKVIATLLDEHATLNDVLHPVAIPAVNVTEGKPQVFKSRHKESWTRDWKYKAVDVALATAAAPTFFELAEVDGQWYADGGLFANAPDLIALHEAEHFFEVPVGAFRLLSIGTTTKDYSVSFKNNRGFGIADWMQNQRLFSVIISAQQQFADQLMKHRLTTNYVRLDADMFNEQANDLGLDVATDAAKRTLSALAKKVVTDELGTKLQPFLSHTPQLKLFQGA